MTATHAVVAEPVAARLGFQYWLGSKVSIVGGRYTGLPEGSPCFREGKVSHLQSWLADRDDSLALAETWFYSDSHNDLPLLGEVAHPVAVDPDDKLAAAARERDWPIISLRRSQ